MSFNVNQFKQFLWLVATYYTDLKVRQRRDPMLEPLGMGGRKKRSGGRGSQQRRKGTGENDVLEAISRMSSYLIL